MIVLPTDRPVQVFIAHDASTSDEDVAQAQREVQQLLDQAAPGRYKAVTGREDHTARFGLCGGWDAWVESVVRGTDSEGYPLFAAVVRVGGSVCGRITAQIFDGMQQIGKPCYLFDGIRLWAGAQAQVMNTEDWKSGYFISAPNVPRLSNGS